MNRYCRGVYEIMDSIGEADGIVEEEQPEKVQTLTSKTTNINQAHNTEDVHQSLTCANIEINQAEKEHQSKNLKLSSDKEKHHLKEPENYGSTLTFYTC
ncbi:Hypothetical predicted protein [Mytilus galloprovincialis]|uniref:Uncharacterized protein n=1 Tax=Mytilus galloprovincialis TaxID=29158 RepID=A0A8B6DZ52_MYTGA|nr:Hypothetical predicted protein [Mytilus galloprovincialis]